MNTGVFRNIFAGERRERALAGAGRLGYELTVAYAAMESTPNSGIHVWVRLKNTGVAPFYYPWPLELGLVGPTGKLITTWPTDWRLTRILPNGALYDFDNPRADLKFPAGDYRVLVRVVNPLPNGLPLRFANQTQDADLPGWLTLGTVKLW